MQSIPVLLLGSGSLVGCDVAQSLLESAWPLIVHTADAEPWAVGLAPHDFAHTMPLVGHVDYERHLIELCQRHHIEGIFVTSNIERDYLAMHRRRLEDLTGARILVSSYNTICLMGDKWAAHCWLEARGFPTIPTLCLPTSPTDLEEFVKGVGFPLMVKPRAGMGSGGVRRLDDPDALSRATKTLTEPHILQTYMLGHEVSVELTRAGDGQILSSVAMTRKHRYGAAWHARIGDFEVERRFCEDVAHALNIYGPCNLQLRWYREEPVLFDINVRWSGSTRVRVLSGVNEVARLAVWELRGVRLPPEQPCNRDIGRMWEYVVLPADVQRDPLS